MSQICHPNHDKKKIQFLETDFLKKKIEIGMNHFQDIT